MNLPAVKSLTAMGILTAFLLTAVSLYAVEDIPAFGDENSAANKYIKLFSIDEDAGLTERLNAGTVPEEIKTRIYDLGFIKGPTCEGCQDENYPTLDEGGYEVNSYWEYHQPAPLAPGIENVLRDGLEKLKAGGVR